MPLVSACASQSRRWLRWGLRLGVAVAGLVLAFRLALPGLGTDGTSALAELGEAWRGPWPWVAACFALAWAILGASLGVAALRFRALLRAAGLEAPLASLFRAYVVATFFNLLLPGAILGDVYRFLDARRDTGAGARVAGVVTIERVLGLAALGAVVAAAAPLLPAAGAGGISAAPIGAAAVVLVAATGAMLWPGASRLVRRVTERLATSGRPRFAATLAARGSEALAATADVTSGRGVVARAFALSLVLQALPVLALFVLATPLETGVELAWFAVIVPTVTLASLAPVTIGGAGVRELLYVTLFGAVGMPAASALALSLSVLAASLAWALVGLVLFAVGRRREPLGASEPSRAAASSQDSSVAS